MRIGITLDENKGLKSQVSHHFGQCRYFLIVETDGKKIGEYRVVSNTAQHGGSCLAVDEILKHKVTHMITGGMGIKAQMKLNNAGIEVFSYTGIAEDGIKKLIENSLDEIEPCKEHEK